MVMTLGMSPEIGQRLLGGQQGGGPFMGRTSATSSVFWDVARWRFFFKKEVDEEALDIQIPPEVWCFSYVLGVQIPSQEVLSREGHVMKITVCIEDHNHAFKVMLWKL